MAMAVSNQQSRDAALLRATTELFVLEAAHDPDEIRRFEELATHFLARVGAADRAFVAERLSKSADAPGSVLRVLGKDLLEIATPILKRSPALSEFDFLTIMASTPPQHHRLIATRGDLSALVVAALRLTGDAEVIARVAAYPAVMTESEALAAEAAPEPAEAQAGPDEAVAEAPPPAPVEQPEPLEAEDEAAAPGPAAPEALEILAAARAIAASSEERTRPAAAKEPMTPAGFLGLDRAARLDLLKRLGDNPSPRREGAGALDADHAFRQALGRARLASLARQRQRDALIRTLAQGLRLAEPDVASLVDDPSGEPLVVLLRGIGLSDDEAQQVLLFANPVIAAGVESFERLGHLVTDTAETVAAELIAAWREGERPATRGVHAPVMADVELRRGMRPQATMPAEAPHRQDPPQRQTFGLRGR